LPFAIGSPKALTFVSSVAVAYGQDTRFVTEEQYGTRLQLERPVGGRYAAGYGTSKWACEVVLETLSEQVGVPVKMFRCSLILGHNEWLGQINAADMLSRLICGLVYTNIAPQSFLSNEEGSYHFDGSAVDFVAESIAALSLRRESGCKMFHCINPHEEDGISLDVIIKWVEEQGGYHFERREYYSWLQEFRSSLLALEGKKKNASPLAILDQYDQPKQPNQKSVRLDATAFRQGVKETTRHSDTPQLNPKFVRRMLEHMASLKLIALEA